MSALVLASILSSRPFEHTAGQEDRLEKHGSWTCVKVFDAFADTVTAEGISSNAQVLGGLDGVPVRTRLDPPSSRPGDARVFRPPERPGRSARPTPASVIEGSLSMCQARDGRESDR